MSKDRVSQASLRRRAGALVFGALPLFALQPLAMAEQPAVDSSVATMEEITVTAQRREQNIQSVGISVTALNADKLTELNINTATDIVRAVPSLKMNAYSSAQVVFNIRGVSQNDYGDQQEPPVAVYQDDSYSSSINLASFPIFDLARVETLRGPQGTLFGRNATGGAIQFISRQPTKQLDGYATLTVGRFGQTIIDGAVGGPLGERLQGRIAAIRNHDDGYMESVVPGIGRRGGNDHYAVRGSLAWQATDATEFTLQTRYMKANKETQAGLYSLEAACPNAQFQGEFTLPNQSCAFWGTGPGQTGTGYRNDAISPSRGGDPWKTAETQRSYVDREIFGTTLHSQFDLGRFTLLSITDFQHSEKFYVEGGDSSPDAGVYFFQGSRLNQASEELRLSATVNQHEVVAGVYGMRVAGAYTGKFADPFYGYDPDVAFSQATHSWAAFAQDEWSLNNQFKLIGGLRYWSDKREGAYFGSAPDVPGLTPPVTIIFNRNQVSPGGSTITPADARRSFDGVTARLELDYKPTDELLLYTSFNRGSKSGGFTFSTGTPYSPNEQTFLEGIPFKPEVLNAAELGLKSTLGGKVTFNADLFYYKYDDYQAFAQFGPVQTVINLNAHEFGAEAEINAHPTSGLTLQLGASYLDSKVKNVTLPDLVTVEDHELPQAPRMSANALARYEFPLGAAGKASIQTDLQYSDKFCFTVLCAPVEREGSYSVANLRLGYAADSGAWDVAAFVDNAFDEKYRVYAFDSSLFSGVVAGVYAKPRTYGLTATWHFGTGR
jgi:iron complex outermembrane receptor protein